MKPLPGKAIIVMDGLVSCPHCKAPRFCVCTTPTGRVVLPPHKARVKKLEAKYGKS